MARIGYKELDAHLSSLKGAEFAPVYLLHGEEVLYRAAADRLIAALLPGGTADMNFEPVDNDRIGEAVQRLNTYSFLGERKVVALRDSRIFLAKETDESLLEKIKDAHGEKDLKRASRFLASLLGRRSLTLEQAVEPEAGGLSKVASDLSEADGWLHEVIDYCREKGIAPEAPKDDAAELQKAIERGFPEGNHLILTVDTADKRRSLYTAIRDRGMVVDCSVPRGNRKADQAAQEAVLRERAREILDPTGKRLSPPAFQQIHRMIGFDLRTFVGSLEKLVSYVGDRTTITPEDVAAVMERTREDPIFELTGALAAGNGADVLFYIDSLLSGGIFPLQILAAMTNQVRKLLQAKALAQSLEKGRWRPGMSYAQFQQTTLAAIQDHDRSLLETFRSWEEAIGGGGDGKKGRKSAQPKTALQLMGKSKSPYPLFLLFQNAERFSREALLDAMVRLKEADLRLKSTGQSPKMVLEETALRICLPDDRKPDFEGATPKRHRFSPGL